MSDYNISLRPHHVDNDLARLNSCVKNLLNIVCASGFSDVCSQLAPFPLR